MMSCTSKPYWDPAHYRSNKDCRKDVDDMDSALKDESFIPLSEGYFLVAHVVGHWSRWCFNSMMNRRNANMIWNGNHEVIWNWNGNQN